MSEFVDISEIPYDTSNFMMPDLGVCHIRVKPYEDEFKEPLAYIIKESGEEVCSFSIQNPYISNNSLSIEDRKALIQFLNTSICDTIFCERKITKFDALWVQWIGKNVIEGLARSTPNQVPDYTKLL